MTGPPDKRKGPLAGGPLPKNIAAVNSDGLNHSLEILISQLRPRPIGPGELAELRSIFWRQAALGHRLPAELGVILLEGGAA